MLGQYVLQAPVVQKVDFAIHRINHYPVYSAIGFPNIYQALVVQWIVQSVSLILIRWIVIYPMDSAIQLLKNCGLLDSDLSSA